MVDQTDAPIFSVILPTYNRSDVLPYSIDSILSQSEKNFELLIVNDGSSDATMEVARHFKDPRIQWFDLPKAPYVGYANRNIALRGAKGDLIAYASHDDMWFPDHLAKMAMPFHRQHVDFAYSMPLWAMPNGVMVPIMDNIEMQDELDQYFELTNFIPSQCVVHRRSCLGRFGYWPEDVAIGGDWELWKSIIEGGGCSNFVYIPFPTGLHFKAHWRSSTSADSMAAVAASSSWWPEALHLKLSKGRPEQVDFFNILRDGSYEWVKTVRMGVDKAIRRLAHENYRNQSKEKAEIRRLKDTIDCLEGMINQRNQLLQSSLVSITGLARDVSSCLAALNENPPLQFNEALYLAANPDVAQAVDCGTIASGFAHWCSVRRHERRPLRNLNAPE